LVAALGFPDVNPSLLEEFPNPEAAWRIRDVEDSFAGLQAAADVLRKNGLALLLASVEKTKMRSGEDVRNFPHCPRPATTHPFASRHRFSVPRQPTNEKWPTLRSFFFRREFGSPLILGVESVRIVFGITILAVPELGGGRPLRREERAE
jgi:hypothetical protein